MSKSLAQHSPHLVDEWSERNLPVTCNDVSFGSNKIYWWHGKCGHYWQASVKSRTAGESCPICRGMRVQPGYNDLESKNPAIAKEWSEKNYPLKPTEVTSGSNKKVWWKCSQGHEWMASIKNRVHGAGCPYCGYRKLLTGFNDLETTRPDIAKEWDYEKNAPLTPDKVFTFANKKVWWKCANGHSWNTLISTRSNGSQCPYCSEIELLPGYNDLKSKYPALALEWSDKNLPLLPSAVNEKSTKNVWWKCRKCGYEWQGVIKARVNGQQCPVCLNKVVLKGYNDLVTTDHAVVEDWDYERNGSDLPEHYHRSSMYYVWWHGKCGHSWRDKIANHVIKHKGCPICEEEFDTLFPQLLLMYYAKMKGINIKLNTDDEIGIPLDTYFPEFGIAFMISEQANPSEAKKQELIRYLCSKNNIKLFEVDRGWSKTKMLHRILDAFQSFNVFICSDSIDDVKEVKNRYISWRKSLVQ